MTSPDASVLGISQILRASRNLIERDTAHVGIRTAQPRPSARLLPLQMFSDNMTGSGGEKLGSFRDAVIVFVLRKACIYYIYHDALRE